MMRTVCTVADNSGVKLARCIHVNGSTGLSEARIGDIAVFAAFKVDPASKIRKGDKIYAIIVRTKSPSNRADGSKLRFSDNAVVIIDKKSGEPIGSRVFGPVAREAANVSSRIASLAHEVV